MDKNLKNFLIWFFLGGLLIVIVGDIFGVDSHNMAYQFNENKNIYEFIYKSLDLIVRFVSLMYLAAYFKVVEIFYDK